MEKNNMNSIQDNSHDNPLIRLSGLNGSPEDSEDSFEEWGPVGLYINPPPSNLRCECCWRHVTELKAFGKAGDPLVGDFDGMILVKTFRMHTQSDEELDIFWDRFYTQYNAVEDWDRAEAIFIKEYGEEVLEELLGYASENGQVDAVWLCRDCIVLEEHEYFETRRRSN